MLKPTPLSIDAGRIDLWLAHYQTMTDPLLLQRLMALLSDAERLQQARFHFADDRQRFLITRAMVRSVLSRYGAQAPHAWRFAANAFGRPQLVDGGADMAGIVFNISHTRGLIAIALSRQRELGVDVENLRTREVSAGVAEHFFAPAEVADLSATAAERRQDRFFEYWTLKEAYIKARGMGLSIPLQQFSFHFPDQRSLRIAIDPALADDATRWAFWQCRPTPEHLLAVCAERLDDSLPTLTLRTIVPGLVEHPTEVAWLRSTAPAPRQ